MEEFQNQDLHGLATPEFVIVAHPDFVQEAIRLGSHRQTQRGWHFVVVTPEQIYNEFSSGRQDVTAIRDFVKHLYDKSSGKLKAALIFGRGSYDYKDRVRSNTNYVPIYESRNSLSPLETYSSDDFYGFLEDGKGTWNELPAENTTLDIGVGRFTVTTNEEATAVVDKIVAYDQGRNVLERGVKTLCSLPMMETTPINFLWIIKATQTSWPNKSNHFIRTSTRGKCLSAPTRRS